VESISPARAPSPSAMPARSYGDPIASAHREWHARGWSEAADGVEAVLLLLRAHRLLVDQIDAALRPQDLTFARYEILMVLSFTRRRGIAVRRLSELLQVHSTSITSAVDLLEREGLARREPNPSDRRSVLVCVTREGRSRAEAGTTALNEQVFSRLGLSSTESLRLWHVLRSLRQSAGDF